MVLPQPPGGPGQWVPMGAGAAPQVPKSFCPLPAKPGAAGTGWDGQGAARGPVSLGSRERAGGAAVPPGLSPLPVPAHGPRPSTARAARGGLQCLWRGGGGCIHMSALHRHKLLGSGCSWAAVSLLQPPQHGGAELWGLAVPCRVSSSVPRGGSAPKSQRGAQGSSRESPHLPPRRRRTRLTAMWLNSLLPVLLQPSSSSSSSPCPRGSELLQAQFLPAFCSGPSPDPGTPHRPSPIKYGKTCTASSFWGCCRGCFWPARLHTSPLGCPLLPRAEVGARCGFTLPMIPEVPGPQHGAVLVVRGA